MYSAGSCISNRDTGWDSAHLPRAAGKTPVDRMVHDQITVLIFKYANDMIPDEAASAQTSFSLINEVAAAPAVAAAVGIGEAAAIAAAVAPAAIRVQRRGAGQPGFSHLPTNGIHCIIKFPLLHQSVYIVVKADVSVQTASGYFMSNTSAAF